VQDHSQNPYSSADPCNADAGNSQRSPLEPAMAFNSLARHVVTTAGDIAVNSSFASKSTGKKLFGDKVALALPWSAPELNASADALVDVRAGRMPVEIRIGAGMIGTGIPLRVLGYAGCIAESLDDIGNLVGSVVPRIALFSSAPKAGHFDPQHATLALVALAGSMRIAGITNPIGIDLAASHCEIPGNLDVNLDADLADWVVDRAMRHRPGEAPSFRYAFEHASPSMFGDLVDGSNPPFRVTLGGATEARFWAVRMQVRAAAAARGAHLAPVAGVIIKALRVPWYQPTAAEPTLTSAHTPPSAAQALAHAANPARGGNGALRRESRAVNRLIDSDGIPELIDAIGSVRAAVRFAHDKGFVFGERLSQTMGDDK